MSALHALLDLPETVALSLTDVRLDDWGRTLILHGSASVDEGGRAFTLRFDDCREMRWRTYVAFEGGDSSTTALVDFALGRDQHRSPAQILASAFGLTLYYGSLTVL